MQCRTSSDYQSYTNSNREQRKNSSVKDHQARLNLIPSSGTKRVSLAVCSCLHTVAKPFGSRFLAECFQCPQVPGLKFPFLIFVIVPSNECDWVLQSPGGTLSCECGFVWRRWKDMMGVLVVPVASVDEKIKVYVGAACVARSENC